MIRLIVTMTILLTSSVQVHAEDEAPVSVVAGLFMKVLAFEKNLSRKKEGLSMFVLNDPAMTKELKRHIGLKIGNAPLEYVEGGARLPDIAPDILVVGPGDNVLTAVKYARQHKLISVTCKPDVVRQGISICITANEAGTPRILVNMAASIASGLNWKPALLKGSSASR